MDPKLFHQMSTAPDPIEIFDRAVEEGQRRLDQQGLELAATSFIAGFTIVFGLAALGIVHSAVEPEFGGIARVAGALAFGVGVVLLIGGRAELFNENFFDPIAAAVERSDSWLVLPLLRLWTYTFVFNLLGGALFVGILSVDGALPPEAGEALSKTAEELAHRGSVGMFADAIAGGTLVALLSHLLVSVNSVRSRLTVAYIVGFLLALGPFDHVIVTVLHVLFGIRFGAEIGVSALVVTTVVSTAGNLVGGLGLVTFSHIAQATGARHSEE